ncbi:hypothetical protein [Actinoplanes sp. NPDC051859]|uniref:hypothetical protein n=1 Tax=Actinoplanes sp. NPDC051859 TaxID=3363909 RepID=UPI0037AD6976
MNNIAWGALASQYADLMPPSSVAGNGRLSNGEWGAAVEDVVVCGSRETLRAWALSIVDSLPSDRAGKPLVVVDRDRQRIWLAGSDALGADPHQRAGWTATVASVCALMTKVIQDGNAAGWQLGEDVTSLFAYVDDEAGDDDAAGLVAGAWVHGYAVGCKPLHDRDMTVRFPTDPEEAAEAMLTVVADRINEAF